MIRSLTRPREHEAARPIGVVRSFASGQTIYFEGDPVSSFQLVVDGMVRSCSAFADGRRFINAFYGAGDILGVEQHAIQPESAEAVNATTLIFYQARDISHFFNAQNGLSPQLITATMHYIAQARDHAKLLGRATAIERLSAFLLERSRRSADRQMVILDMPRQDIADYLGLTPETISRCLARLRQSGLIKFISSRELKLLNIAGLRDLSV